MKDEHKTKQRLLKELAELRESEELHRLTLSNISDTVLITDDAGAFTYICPNVHFIFGYSHDEVEGFGNIEKLLGGNICDDSLLRRRGEIRNVERRIRDKGGAEHVLLVNVKRVSIHGGTTLYGCRDITSRKAAEEAVQQAHDELERRVEERAAELLEANQRLRNEVRERKSAEKELREIEVRLRLVTDSLPVLISYVDSGQRYRFMNEAYREWFGVDPEKGLGSHIREVLGESAYQEVRNHVEAALSGEQVSFEIALTKRDGNGRNISAIYVPNFGKQGDVKGFVVLASDITERKYFEEALRERELWMRSTFDALEESVIIATPDRVIKDVNSATERIFGYAKDEVTGRLTEIFHVDRDHYLEFGERIEEAFDRGESAEFEFHGKRKNGEIFPTDHTAALLRNPYNEPIGMVSVVRDITNRKKAEDALRQSEERFRTVFESARDCIFIKDRSQRYVMVNPFMADLFGLPSESVSGKTDEDMFGRETAQHLTSVDSRVLEGEIVEEEHTRPVKGTPTTFLDTRYPLHDSAGNRVGICGISRNITDRRTLWSRPVTPGEYPSQAMRSTLQAARLAARTDSIVLVTGESGSGKDVLARYIHDNSGRKRGSFYAVNCAAIPSELAESELFGHEPGAFSGAVRRKRGLLELAEGGTLLLNEIGELPLGLQAKLLTFLDSKTFTRLGGEKSVTANARIVAATNRDLKEEISLGRFRQDLFYRLNVLSIAVPPLRERVEDIPTLVEHLVSEIAKELQLSTVPLTGPADMQRLESYEWPGNVRELRNVLERAMILSSSGQLHIALAEDRPERDAWSLNVRFPSKESLEDVLKDVRGSLLEEALRRSRGRRQEAADLLGVSRYTVMRHVKSLGLKGGDVA